METTVMIGEKPKVASRLANALGNYSTKENRGVKNYVLETDDRKIIIAPAVGHIFNLEQTEEGWDYPVFDVEWQPIFENQDSADYVKKYYNNLKDQLDKADTYINACDFDVEGCLHEEEKLVVRKGGEIQIRKAGELIDEILKNNETEFDGAFEYAECDLDIIGMQDWDSGFEDVEKIMRRPSDDTFLEITAFNGRKIKVSKNHPVLISTDRGLETVKAEKLEEGDHLLATRKIPSSSQKTELDLIDELDDIYIHGFKADMEIMPAEMCQFIEKTRKQCLNYRHHDRMPKDIFLGLEDHLGVERENLTVTSPKGSTSLPAKLNLDYELGRIAGLYLAEGCIDSGGFVGFYFGPEEDELVQEVESFLEKIGTEGKTRKRKVEGSYGDSECFEVGTKSRIFRELIENLGLGKNSGSKSLPNWILCAKEEFRNGLISGYWEGDGSVFVDNNDNRAIASATSKSRDLLQEIFYLMQTEGINLSFQGWNSKRDVINVTAGRKEEIVKLLEIIDADQEFKNQLESTVIDSSHQKLDRLPTELAQRQVLNYQGSSKIKDLDTIAEKDISQWEKEMENYADGDVTFLKVTDIEEKETNSDYFYDFETSSRNFMHGNGIITHNSTIGGTILKEMVDADEERIQRMKFSTLTPSDLQDAFDNLEEFDRGMTEAGITRHILDFYYGINVSRALMKAVRAADRYKTLSTGRVQGPTLKILADREREIQEFEPDPYWELYLNHPEFQAQWEDDEDRIWDGEIAEKKFQKVKDEKEAEVTNVKVNNYKHNPPIPFNLTGLQSEASSQLNISPKQTQSIAQTLYENGLISYPRTESQKLPPKIGYKNILKSLKGQEDYDDLAKKVLKKDKNDNLYTTQGKKEDDAHPAIYPTGESPSASLSKKEGQVYDLIVKRFFAVFGKPAKRRSITFTLDVKDEEFKAKSKITVERNWYDLYEPYVRVDSAELPEMEEGQTLPIDSFDKEEKETQPPNRYSQSGIVNELEKRNLGTKCLTENQEVIIKDGKSLSKTPISKVFGSETDNGTIQIKELEENVEVIGFDNNFSLTEFAGLSRRKLKENETVLQINLEDGSSIELTSNHPVLTLKDDKLTYKQAGSLKPKDKVIRAHRGSLERRNEIEFDEFVQNLDKKSSLYGSCDLRKLRNRREVSQREFAKKLETPRSTLSKVENRKHGLLRYWKNADIPEPDYISSENFDLKIRNPFPLKIGPAFLRLTAMLQGDGSLDSVGKNRENKIDFRYHNTKKELIEQFRKDTQKIFGFKPEKKSQPPSTGEKTRHHIQLPAVIGRIITIITQNLSREWIMKQGAKEHYIGAMIADEGHISPSEPKIFISNTDKDILRNCKDSLKELEIDSKINEDQKKLYIRGRENLEKFLEQIPLFSTRKHQALINLLERHYKYGEDKGSLEKEKNVLKALQRERKQLEEIAKYTGLKQQVAKYHLDNLREKGYAEKIIEGISERPRKKIYYQAQEKLSDTFYSEIGEKAVGEAHTATIKSIEKTNYNGYVYDILDTENQNFLLENRCVVHNSTRAQTVDRLYDRNYIEEQPIEVTDLGLVVVETLEDYSPDLVSEGLTREFEEKMDAIREENESREEVLSEAQDKLINTLTNFKEKQGEIGEKLVDTIDSERKRRRRLGPCQECEDGMLRIIKKGGSSFVGCSNYPDCENTYPLPNNGNINSTDQECQECGKPTIYVDRKKGKNYQMCVDPDCPSKDDW